MDIEAYRVGMPVRLRDPSTRSGLGEVGQVVDIAGRGRDPQFPDGRLTVELRGSGYALRAPGDVELVRSALPDAGELDTLPAVDSPRLNPLCLGGVHHFGTTGRCLCCGAEPGERCTCIEEPSTRCARRNPCGDPACYCANTSEPE